jgi:acyl carrier protein
MNEPSTNDLIEFIKRELAKLLSVSSETINIETPFDKYGLDSAKAILMVGKLEDYLDIELPAKLLWDYNNIKSLSEHLHQSGSLYK